MLKLAHLSRLSNLIRLKNKTIYVLPLRSHSNETTSFLGDTIDSKQRFQQTKAYIEKNFIAKYFAKDEQFQGWTGLEIQKNVLSPEVLATMIAEVVKDVKSVDHKTIDMLVKQAIRAGSSSRAVIEVVIDFYLSSGNVVAAANIVSRCNPNKIAISEEICKRLANALVENCNWHHAFLSSIYMITLDYKFSSNIIFFTVGGLMRDVEGVHKSLELIKLITLKQRSDLADMFSFAKVII